MKPMINRIGRKRGSAVALAALMMLVLTGVETRAQPVFWTEAPTPPTSPERSGMALASFAPLAEKAMPGVVTVYTKKEVRIPSLFFGAVPFLQEGTGSGFIISSDGYILTNNHVIKGSDSVKVKVGVKHKKDYDAKVVGVDEEIDVALIKIDAEDLPVMALGTSDALKVGDWVAAIGSPYNLSHTFTVGVVSAKGRRRPNSNYDELIQTDASINSGNSAGPLINMQGEVVGINTMILSPTGGNVGIGFSIPVNLVKMILPQLRESGKVTRSWLGVSIEQVTADIAEDAGMSRRYGAHVTQLVIGSPAEKAGIKIGDVIVEFNGRKIEDPHELPALVSSYGVGKSAEVSWFHQGKKITRDVLLEKLPARKEMEKLMVRGSANVDNVLGAGVRDLNDEDREAMGLSGLEGVLVVQVAEGSPAAENGIQPGDVITKMNFANMRTVSDFERAVDGLKEGSYVRINVRRGSANIFRVFRIPRTE